MAKPGGSVKVSLLQDPVFGLHQQGLAESEHSFLVLATQPFSMKSHWSPHHSGQNNQRVDALVRQDIIGGGLVLDQFAVLNEVALANFIDLVEDLIDLLVEVW